MRRLPLPRITSVSTALVAFLLAGAAPAAAQQGDTTADSSGGPGYHLPEHPTKPLRFTTTEGTWMSLDVSNDGQWVVFDLLGDIYKMPIGGGTATRLTSGQAFDGQPNFSPDGKTIVFASDRSGSENLWLMNADGSHVRALTKENDHSFVSPTWTPDGQYVVASRSNSFSGGSYNVYMYYVGGGTGLQLTGTDTAAAGGRGGGRGGAGALNNFVGPAFGPDGRYMYVAARNGGGGYNQTSLGWQIAVYDRETGHTYIRTDAPGSGMRPEVSPDGKWLVYATREDSVTSLRIRDLSTGDEHWLVHRVQRDDQESRFTRDLEPPFAFTPDGKAVVVAYLGHFWRVGVPDGQATMIPFSADYDEMIAGAIKDQYPFDDSTITVHQIRDLAPSPDGKRMAFTALDRVWVMDLPGGTPHRLVASSTVGEYSPAWSPDGRYIAYVTWSDVTGGDIYRVRADGQGAPQKLTTQPAYYEELAYSPDGSRLVFGRGPRDMRRDRDELERPNAQATGVELAWMPSSGGPATMIAPLVSFGQPHFGPDTSRIYLFQGGQLTSMRWDGTDIKDILRVGGGGRRGGGGGGASNMLISPDGSKVLVQSGVQAYLVDAVPMTGGAAPEVTLAGQSAVPVHRLTTVGGEFATWTADSRTIYLSLAHTLFTYDVAAAATAIADSTERADSIAAARGGNGRSGRGGGAGGAGGRGGRGSESGAANKPAYEAAQHDVVITVARDVPRGTVVLRGARIITMKGDEVIANGDIVVTDNRIAAIGARGQVAIPRGARVIDVSGKTIIPGYVDIHAHIWPAFGVHRSQPFEYMVNLAYGVTTTRDPQTSATDVLSYEDMVATGQFIGPRIYSTGPGVFAAENIKSLADAQLVLSRYSKYYQTNTIKQYMTGDRRVRQFVEMAAREQHLMPTLEGGLDFKKNLTEAMDGYSGSEHTLPIAPLYKDVIELYATAGITWTPTLIVQYGGPWAENYWYEHTDVLDDPKLNHFTPRDVVEKKASRRPGWWAPSQWSFPLFAAQAAKVVAAGGRVGMGSHGQLQGLGAQWEIWNIASGGMPRMDVLRVATIFGAEAIGLEKELGSLEPGKLADLQVLDKNPLDDIKNTNTIEYVMKNGRLYDGNTLNEIWPQTKAAPTLWWWKEKQ